MLNRVVLIGRVTEKPEILVLNKKSRVCKVIICVGRPEKNEEGVKVYDLFRLSIYDEKIIDDFSCLIDKNSLIAIQGRLEQPSWGALKIVVEKATFL